MATLRRAGFILTLNDAGIRDILRSGGVSSAVESETESLAGRARSGAPVESNEYKSGIGVEMSSTRTRARGRVVASAPHSTVVESRTGNLKRAIGGGR